MYQERVLQAVIFFSLEKSSQRFVYTCQSSIVFGFIVKLSYVLATLSK